MSASGRRSKAAEGLVKRIDEGKISFAFGERWQVEKWDACNAYLGGIRKLNGELTEADGTARKEGTKAVDFVGVLDEEKLYLCEVKDFRGHRLENKKRQMSELPLEIGLKVRDTLAGLAGSYAKKGGQGWVELCGQVLVARKHQVHVIAWIADDSVRSGETRRERAAHDSVRLSRLKQRLSWLTARVWVEDPFEQGLPDVTVENLPGAGQG
jgi:hypothetical protein